MSRTAHKDWEIRLDQFGGEADNDLLQSLLELVTICNRVGGGGVFATVREEIEPDVWLTTGVKFRWESYTPGKRLDNGAQPAEVVEEPVPVA